MIPVNLESGLAFAGNPIYVSTIDFLQGGASDDIGRFIVSLDFREIYKGRFEPGSVLELSEIIAASVRPIREAPGDGQIIEVEDSGYFDERRVTVSGQLEDASLSCSLIVLPGGVSKRELRATATTGADIFERRFLRRNVNFFLTTRTAGNRIAIKETELSPLYFVVGDSGIGEISVRERLSGVALTYDALTSGIYALNLSAIRRELFFSHNVLGSVFDVYVDGVFSCRITIEESEPTQHRYRLKFRNSLGVFDYFETTGEILVEAEGENAESWKQPDFITGGFFDTRDRAETRETLKINTGPVLQHRIALLRDLLGSEEIYLLDYSPEPVRIISSEEVLEHAADPMAPASFELRFVRAEADAFADNVIDRTDRPRIFSGHFTSEFV